MCIKTRRGAPPAQMFTCCCLLEQPRLVFLPREAHGQRSLEGYSLWGRQESDTTEATCVCVLVAQSCPTLCPEGQRTPQDPELWEELGGGGVCASRQSPPHTEAGGQMSAQDWLAEALSIDPPDPRLPVHPRLPGSYAGWGLGCLGTWPGWMHPFLACDVGLTASWSRTPQPRKWGCFRGWRSDSGAEC